MHVPAAKSRSELSEKIADIANRGRPGSGRDARSRHPFALILAKTEIGSDDQMQRRMLDPIVGQLFDIEERHRIDYRIAVAAGGGEETVNMSPAVAGTEASAPGSAPGAAASPGKQS